MNLTTILRSAQAVINSRTISTTSVSNAAPSKKSTLTSFMLALSLLFSLLRVESGLGQVVTNIYATGTAGSFKTGSVNSAGTKNDGNMVTVNSSSNRGWSSFDLSSIPTGSTISSVVLTYTTYNVAASLASNNIYGFTGIPSTTTGSALYTNCGSGTAIAAAATWPTNATGTLTLNTTGITFIQNNCGSSFVNIGYVRGSSNTYNIYGYPGTTAQQPKLTITYVVPPPCSGVPNAGTSLISSASGCANANVNLSATGLSTGIGISYQWQSSIDNGVSWNNIVGATSSTASVTPSVTTMYRIRTTCSNSASSNNSSTITYTVNVSGACLCGSYPLIYASNTADEEITNVTVGSMNNTSNCTTAATGSGSVLTCYANYSGVVTGPSVMQGSSVNFSLTQTSCGGAYANIFQLYVDWNQDGDWLDAGEQVYNQGTPVSGNQTVSGSFTVPAGATPGTTRMRVVNIEMSPTATNYAHTGYTYGETEDYCFTVLTITPCSGTPSVGQAAAWSPSAVTGFNADVIANGVGVASSSATQFDLGGYGLVSADFQAVAGNAAPTYSLPLNGIVNSTTNAGINYQMASYSSSNSLRLVAGTTSGTLTLSSGTTAKRISFLTSSGSGASTFTAQVNFSDLTNQQFTGNSVSDWYGSAYAIAPIGRILLTTNVVDGTTTSPGLYDVVLTLSAGNQSKTITSIQFTKTDVNASALNILGISLQTNTPTAVICNGQSRILSLPDLNSAVTGLTYQWQSSTSSTGPWSNVTGATAATYTTPALTTAGIVYYRCNVTCTNSASAASSTPVALTVNPALSITPSSGAVCSGSSLQANPSSNSTYLWSNNATTSSISITSAGTYSVLISNNGCVSKPSATVTLLSAPTVTSTGSVNAVCSSSSAQTSTFNYTASTNSPTSYSIDWNASANTAGLADVSTTSHSFLSGGSSFSVPIGASTAPGVYNGVLSFTNANGCVGTLAVNITITNIPTLTGVSQTSSLCYNPTISSTNASIQLSGLLLNTAQTATYNFNGGTSQTIAFTSTASGTATLAIPVTMANHGQTLSITIINCANFTSNNSCVLTIIQVPTASTISPATLTVNIGASATTTAALNNSSNTLRWWNAASAGNQVDADVTTPGLDDAVFNSYQAQINPPIPNNTPTPNVAFCTPSTNYTYYVEEFDAVSGCPSTRTPFVITTNPLFSNTPSNLLICQAGGSVTLQANITPLASQSFQWLSSTTGTPTTTNAAGSSTSSIYLAAPSVTTNYKLNMDLTPFGCSTSLNTSQMFAVGVLPANSFTPTATPSSVCIGGTSSLAANLSSSGFATSTIPVSFSVPTSSTTLVSGGVANVAQTSGTLDDGGWSGLPLGFSYNFFGNSYTSVNIGTNAVLQFGAYNATQLADFTFTSLPNALEPLNIIAVAAADYDYRNANSSTGTFGTMTYWTEGIAPTRRFVVNYSNVNQYSSGPGTTIAQVKLFETTGIVEVHVQSSSTTNNKVVGLQNFDASIGAMPYSSSGSITNQAWRFTPGANYTYQWYLGANTSTPLSGATSGTYTTTTGQSATPGQKTYTVAAMNPTTGCASTQPATITVNALPSAPISSGNVTACNNAAATTLTATAPTGCVVEWFSNSAGSGTPLSIGSTYTFTPSATAGTYTYYAFSRNTTTTCASSTGTAVLLTVVTSPAAPSASTTSVTYCQGLSSSQLAASALSGNTLNWYSGTLGVNASSTAPTPSTATNVGSPFTFYATQTSGTNGCEGNPTTFTITVNPTPSAPAYSSTYTTGTITQCQGTAPISIANAVVASVGGTLYYYTVPTGGTALSATPSSTPSVAGTTTYYVSQVISGCEGPRTVVTSVVNPSLTPLVAISASSTTVCPGGSITYNAVPTNGGPAPTYAWFVNSTQVGTGSTYTQATPVFLDAIYATMVSNEPSCLFTPNATSATITLNNSSVTPSVSIVQNTGTTICANSSVSFSVANALNMGASPTYAWKVNGTTVGTSSTYTTTTLTNNAVVTLTITSSLPSNCLTGGIAAANSAGITMTITPITAITAQPANASVCLGGAQSLAVTAIGTGTITYQWQSAATTAGPFTNISFASNTSAQSATLSIPSVAGQLSYQLVATSSCGNATSSIATISINQATGITAQPQAVVACDGTTATFNVTAVGTGAISYQWRFNGTPIAAATSASYSIPTISSSNAGQYSVVVSATCGSVTSTNAQLTVNPLTTISSQPVNASICDSTSLSLSVVASGTAPISYQWKLNGTPISGATSALYSDAIATVAESGQYTVQVTGFCSILTSSTATVVVSPNTWITAQPVSYTGCALNPTSLTVTGLGANVQYQWSIGTNPSTPITGATSATYSLSNPQTSNSGSYTVTMTGTCGAQTSNIALVTINPVPSAGTITGGNSGVCVGSTINLTNLASGGVWTSSNQLMGSISASGVLTGVSTGTITVTYTVTNSFGCVSTATKVIQVKGLPTAAIQTPLATSICQGEAMNLQSSAAVSYAWSTGATTQNISVNSSATGTINYSVTVTGTNACTATSAPVAITVIPVPTVAAITGSGNYPNFCLGNTSNLTNATANGLWSSSNTNVLTVNPLSGAANTLTIGTATVSYYVSNVPGCLNPNPGTATATITVSTPPAAFITSSGSTTFCQGGSITLTAPTGVGYNYLWSTGATTQTITVSTSGSYSLTVTATGGCSVTSLPTTVNVLPIPTATIYPTGAINICSGTNVNLSTGSAVSYVWSNGAITPTVSVNASGTYSVTLTGTNGCTVTSALSIVTVTPVPSAVITANGPTNICDGGSVGLSVPTAGSYLWSNGATTQAITATSTGNYSVTATNGICSTTSTPTYVNFNPVPSSSVTASGPTTFCQGGSVILSAPTGNSFTYLWSNGATTQSITIAASGTYSVTVSNSFNCSSTSIPISVVVNALPTASITAGGSTTICSGNSLSLTAASANAYLWSTGATTQSINAATTGNYTVQAISAAGCTATSSVVALNVLPSPTAVVTQASGTTFCQGGSVVINSTPASSYLWSNNETTQAVSATTTGVYSVLVTAANGCTATSNSINVNVLPIPTAVIYPGTNVNICAGSTVTLSTGTAASYTWSNGANTPTITVGTNSTHTVMLVGSNGCTATSAVSTITVNPIPVATITASGTTNICSGTSVNLTASTAGSYLWSNGATTQTIAASLAGAYTVTVTTAGCSATSTSTTVNVNQSPTANVIASGPTSFCQGGSVSFTANAGNGYTYLWSNGSTTATISTSTSGNNSVTVTNLIGCSTTSAVNAVVVNPIPVATITAGGSTTICSGTPVSLSAPTGGNYLWNTGSISQSINVATAGNYTVVVTSAAGCSATSAPTTIAVNALPSAAISSSGSTTFCQGGTVGLSANSGMTSYLWSNGGTGQSIAAGNSGGYTVVVTDANGCSATSNLINVNVNPAPTATIFPGTNVTICSGSSVTLSTNSAVSYNWSTGAITPTIQVNTPGNYSVTLTGSNGCSATSPLTIVAVTTTPTAAITSSGSTTLCQGSNVSLSAPAAANSYLWNTGATTQTITVSLVGSYFVTVGSNGCSATSPSTFVSYNPVPSAAVTASGPTTFCLGNSVSFSAPTGNGNSYLWNTGATTQSVSTSTPGTFSVTVTNGYGCSASSAVNTVLVNPLPVVTPITGSSSICAGTQGQVSNVMTGGVYASSNLGVASIGQLNGQISGLTAGTTTISYIYTNSNGCSNTVTYPVTITSVPVATITAGGPTTFCQGGSVTLTASSGTAYAWSNGATTASITVSASGSYSVSVTGANGCSASSQATTVNVLTPSPVSAINGANSVCVNSATSFTNTTSGGTWSSSNPLIASVSTAGNVTGVSAGSATITYAINSTNGCQNAATKVVNVNMVPATALTTSGATTFCQGSNVSLTASSGSTYLWSTGATTASITASTSGTYNVTVTNANGCSSVSTNQLITVNANPTAAISTNGSTNLCTGGSIVLMATPSSSYLWNTGATTSSITATTAGLYSVTVTNANGCSATSTATSVVVNASPSATVTASGPTSICSGSNVVLSATSVVGNTYQWSNNGVLISGATSASYTATTSGTYAATVTNASGCSATSTTTPVSVVLATAATITPSGSTSLCNNASVTLTATSGASYLWSNGATTQSITVNTAGNYTATVTNSSGCSAISVATPVIVNASPTATITAGGATTFCQGSNVVLTASAGASYLWSNGATTSTITASTPGTYSVLITNASGCSATSAGSTITVNAAPNATIIASGNTTFCSGGSVTLTASPGTSYLWSTGATTASISVNTAGASTVTVTNAAGCSTTSASTTIVVNATPTASISAGGSTTICSGSTVTLTASAGSNYLWSNGATTASIVANTTGNYTVTVFNANGCSAISTPTTVTVNNPSVANISTSGSTTFCTGGSVNLTATAASSYLWSTGATTQTISVNTTGNYTVVLTNASGCTSTSPVTTVTANVLPTVSIAAGGPITFCQGGSVNLTASAATSYVWSNGATTASVNITTPGSYTVQISNSTGCTATSTATVVTVNALPTASITASGSTNLCAGTNVTLTASAGSTYLWSTGATTASIVVTTAGSRTVTVTNAAGCSSTSSPTNIVVNALPTPSITSIGSTTICQGATVTLTTANGTGLTYQWKNNGTNIPGATAVSYVANAVGSYTVQVTNAAGCIGTSTATAVVVNALPVASISNSGANTICAGTSVNLTASGGTAYTWSNGATSATIAANTTGNYTVSVSNAAGCTSSTSTAITVVMPTVASIAASGPTSFCAGQNVVLTANPGASYVWSTGATTASITVAATNNVSVQVTYVSGCVSTSPVTAVTANSLPTATIAASGATSFCPGATVTLTASAGSSYVWTNGATTNSIVVSASGSYGVSITNASGCVATAALTAITVFAVPTASITTSGATTFCQGSTLNLTANTGASYVWSSGETTSSISTGVSGNYSVTVLDANGCSAVSSIVPVTVNANPVATIQANGPTNVCQGTTVVLSANGGTGFAWSNAEITSSISVTTTGSYGVTVTNAAGCSSVVTPVSITVNPVQVLSPIVGASNVCVGASTTYTNSTSGGTWSSDNTAVATVNSTSGNVSGISTGSATIKYQFVNAFGCTSEVTNVVTVNGIQPVSIVASGSTSFCQGGSVTLTAPAGLNYNWTNGQTTQSITVNTSGTFALAASNAAGCFTTSSTVVVTMNPAPVVNITSTSTTLCQGSNLVLNAPANAASYAWSNGATTQTILINTPGTYSLTLTDANGCSASTNTTIVNGINPIASISAGGVTTFCQGGNVVLNAAGGTSFLWNNGATTQNISVTAPGNYSVMVTNAAGCSSMSNSTIVNVLQAPVAVVTAYGSTTFCQGGSVIIATSGGTSYAWSNGSTSQSIIPTTSGSYSVITTGANGCTATSNAINVTVNPTPTAVITPSGATTFCEGSSVNLVASGGATYAWNNGSTAATLAATTGGVYTVTVTNAGGCTDTETSTVTVYEVPSDFIVTSGATTFCQGGEVSLTAQAGNSYVWSNNATTQSIAVTTAGTYSVTILSPNGCSVTTNAITVDVNQPSASNLNATAYDGYTLNGILYTQSGTYTQTLTNAAGCDSTITLDLTLTVGIEEGTLTDVSLYPNPTSESFMIQTSIALYCTYSVVDAQGKLVFEGEMTGTETQVNISSVARGIYYLRISELSEPLRVVKN